MFLHPPKPYSLRAYVTPPDEPHAFAEEDEPSYNKKSPAPKLPTPKGPASGIAYEDPDNRPVGTNYQASIPTLRPRPAQATASEAKFLQLQPLYAADPQGAASSAARAAAAAAFKARYQAAPDAAARRSLLEAAVQELDAQLGPHMVKVRSTVGLGSLLLFAASAAVAIWLCFLTMQHAQQSRLHTVVDMYQEIAAA